MTFLEHISKSPTILLWIYLLFINLALFIAMGVDKRRARRGMWRIPEKRLFTLAMLGGSAGGLIGMYLFRHKTLHRSFAWGFPAILVFETALGLYIALK